MINYQIDKFSKLKQVMALGSTPPSTPSLRAKRSNPARKQRLVQLGQLSEALLSSWIASSTLRSESQ